MPPWLVHFAEAEARPSHPTGPPGSVAPRHSSRRMRRSAALQASRETLSRLGPRSRPYQAIRGLGPRRASLVPVDARGEPAAAGEIHPIRSEFEVARIRTRRPLDAIPRGSQERSHNRSNVLPLWATPQIPSLSYGELIDPVSAEVHPEVPVWGSHRGHDTAGRARDADARHTNATARAGHGRHRAGGQ